MRRPTQAWRLTLAGALALTAAACHGSGGSKTAGTGGAAPGGTAGAAGAAGTTGAGGTTGAAGAAGTTGAAGSSGAAGTTGVAGTSGTAGAAGGGGGGVATDPCTTALFCDDFESYAAGQSPGGNWTKTTNLGAVAIDTTQFHSGTKSVKLTTQAGSASKTAFIHLASTSAKAIFPAPGNMFYGRMMFRLEAAPTTSVHWTMIAGSGLIAGQSYHALYRYGGQLPITQGTSFVGSQLMANYETPDEYSGNGPASDCWNHANNIVVPVATWSCVEWQFDGPNNTMRLWLDGTAVTSLTVTGVGQGCVNQPATYPWTAPAFDRLDLGWESYQQDDARTFYVDDVVVSTTKIGCPQ